MNLPNKLTLLRIAMVPLVVLIFLLVPSKWAVIDSTSGFALRDLFAFLVFVAASVTDFFDGYIARKYNLITSLGKFSDPIADKLLINTLMILLAYSQQMSVVAVLLMISRDLIVDGLRMVASQQGQVVSAGIFGKLKTVLQMIALALLLLRNWPFAGIGLPMATIFVWAATAMSLYSGYVYFMKLKHLIFESM